MLNTPIGRLRLVGMLEGLSFLVLMGIAMPLKYMAGDPRAVQVTGWIHGVLFVLYLAALAHAAMVHGKPRSWVLTGFIASLLPFGPFVWDSRLRGSEDAKPAEAS